MRVLGIILVIAGVALLIYGGVTFLVPREVVDLGVFSITVRENVRIPLPPVVGAVFLIGGIFMIMSAPGPAPRY
jgi:hypothetical protein